MDFSLQISAFSSIDGHFLHTANYLEVWDPLRWNGCLYDCSVHVPDWEASKYSAESLERCILVFSQFYQVLQQVSLRPSLAVCWWRVVSSGIWLMGVDSLFSLLDLHPDLSVAIRLESFGVHPGFHPVRLFHLRIVYCVFSIGLWQHKTKYSSVTFDFSRAWLNHHRIGVTDVVSSMKNQQDTCTERAFWWNGGGSNSIICCNDV